MILDLSLVSMISILLPAVFGIIFYRHLPSPVRTLWIFLFCSVFIEASGYLCFLMKVNNMPLFHFHTFMESAFLTVIFYQLFQTINAKLILVLAFCGFVSYMVIDLIFVSSLFEPNSTSKTIESVFVILLCSTLLYELNKLKSSTSHYKRSYSILNMGLLIYFLGTILVSYYSYRLMGEKPYEIWMIRSTLNILLNILYTVVIWNSVGLRKLSH